MMVRDNFILTAVLNDDRSHYEIVCDWDTERKYLGTGHNPTAAYESLFRKLHAACKDEIPSFAHAKQEIGPNE